MDALLSLSFAVQSNKGVFAILLGSGISQAAGIPTGWGIITDLISKIAVSRAQQIQGDAILWYRKEYKEGPNYGELLEAVARTPDERRSILESYFEPTEDERNEGKKIPTPAHREIANLVARGFVKLIITTNFDRLAEIALQEVGITPTVIYNEDGLKGATPLTHSNCTVLKLHGDYKDVRIKNTEGELTKYSPKMNKLLDRIFDEYGLIVCGWSAKWDIALRNALFRRKNRRYSIYWATLNTPTGKAKDLIDFLSAENIITDSADRFFSDISEKVFAIEDRNELHPLTVETAIVTIKKYLAKSEYHIRLHDLMHMETKKAMAACSEVSFRAENPADEAVKNRLAQYEQSVDILMNLYIQACFFDSSSNDLWYKKLSEFAAINRPRSGNTVWIEMALYPVMLLYYAACMSCLAKGNYELLYSLTSEFTIWNFSEYTHVSRYTVAYDILYPEYVLEKLCGEQRYFNGMGVHDHLLEFLKPRFEAIFLHKKDMEFCFDVFEYFTGLLRHHLDDEIPGPHGRFLHSRTVYGSADDKFLNENRLLDYGKMLQVGFFGGNKDSLEKPKKQYDDLIRKICRQRH